MKKLLCIGIALLSLLLCACASQNGGGYVNYNGETLSESEMRALVKSKVETKSSENEKTAIPCETGEPLSEGVSPVYWTSGGSVWHTSLSCGHLSASSKIYFGTENDAIANGKDRVCSTCGKQSQEP